MSNNEDRGFNTVNNSSLSRRDQRLQLQRMTLMVIGALMVILVITLFALIIGFFVSNGDNTPDDPNNPSGEVSKDKVIWATVPVSAQDTVIGDLLLVNGTHQYTFPSTTDHLGKAYDVWAAHSTKVYQLGSDIKLDAAALSAVDKMLTDLAAATGYSETVLASGYRSFEDQESIGSATKGGYSDHHTGRLCSLNVKNDTAKAWLDTNAAKYGFVVRYPEDKGDKTGVTGYASAYRYVGVAHATYMVANNLCLEEYIEYLQANVNDKSPLTVTGADGKVYEVYYYAVNGSATVKYPTNFSYTISGTNDGGVVVTVDRSASAAETTAETTADTNAG